MPRPQQDQDPVPTVSHRDLSLVMSPVVRHSTVGRTGPEIRQPPLAVPPVEVWVGPTLRGSDRRHALPFFRSCRRASLNGELSLAIFIDFDCLYYLLLLLFFEFYFWYFLDLHFSKL